MEIDPQTFFLQNFIAVHNKYLLLYVEYLCEENNVF